MQKKQHNMKPVLKRRSGSESCSCTTCVYNNSGSDHPSLKQFQTQGSRIDRLYYGKYIPLREKKLLERLVRTRAVYDDIRAQLLDESTISLSTKRDFNTRKQTSHKVEDDEKKSSGAMLEFVNMVDRGAALGSKKLADCCSCCSCSSKFQIHQHSFKRRRPKRIHADAIEHYSRERQGETYHRKKGVRFKVKHIWSAPCMCTFKFSGMIKNSRDVFKNIRPNLHLPLLDIQPTTDKKVKQKRRIWDKIRTSHQNFIQPNLDVNQGVVERKKKIRESETQIELQAKKSLEKLTQAKNMLTVKLRNSVRKLRARKEINNPQCSCPEKEIVIQVKKDSISKFKEEIRRKNIMKDWECELECVKEKCVPEECFVRLKLKRSNLQNLPHKDVDYNITTRKQNIEVLLGQSNVTNKHKREIARPRINIDKNVVKTKKTKVGTLNKREQKSKCDCEVPKHTPIMNKVITPPTLRSGNRKSSERQAVRIGSSFSFNIEFYKNRPGTKMSTNNLQTLTVSKRPGIDYNYARTAKMKKVKKLKSKSTRLKIRQPIKKNMTTIEKSGLSLNSSTLPCTDYCTPDYQCDIIECIKRKLSDLQANADCKPKRPFKLTEKKKKTNVHTSDLLPYECEPTACIPDKCNPYQCIDLINARRRKKRLKSCICSRNLLPRSTKIKSSSSFTSRSYKPSRAKYVQSMITYRGATFKPVIKKKQEKEYERGNTANQRHNQAVRTGSTFSFNIELHKAMHSNKKARELRHLLIKPKQKAYYNIKLKDRGYQGIVGNIRSNTQPQMFKKKRKVQIGTALRRCLCTLKLQKKETMKRQNKNPSTTGIEIIESKHLQVPSVNRGTKTKPKYLRPLKSFECEPLSCNPEICDPYVCSDRINKRNIRLKEAGSATDHSHTTSISCTCITYSEKSTKAVQYKPKYKAQKVSAKSQKPKKFTKKESFSKCQGIMNSRQAVNIGSTISFDIEFFKKKLPSKEDEYRKEREKKNKTLKKIQNKGRKMIRLNVANIDTQVQKSKIPYKRSAVAPLLKRCFCTLNLQKKSKHQHSNTEISPVGGPVFRLPTNYIVHRTAFEKTRFLSRYRRNVNQIILDNSFHINPNRSQSSQLIKTSSRLKQSHITIYKRSVLSVNCNSLQFKTSDPIKSNYKFANQNVVRMSHGCQTSHRRIEQSNNFTKERDDTRDFNMNSPSSLTQNIHADGLTSYFQQSFCTMNFKVENRGITKRLENTNHSKQNRMKKNGLHKLKPYECEPGICIPGECNPYECQKVISQRLMKNSSKKSGTKSKSIISSSQQHNNKSKSKSQPTITQHLIKPYITYKDIPNKNYEKFVHMGSSFSFHIQFPKNLKMSQRNLVPPKYSFNTSLPQKKFAKHESKFQGSVRKKSVDSKSQSAIGKTVQRGTLAMPTTNRCFCTLKLQKKGRLHKQFKTKQSSVPSEKNIEVRTVNRGQNINFKPMKIAHSLKTYECEPNICVPGQCDPYQCLDVMKKIKYYKHKNGIGTSTILHDRKSISNMTKENYKPKNIINKPKTMKSSVRVSSNFSFNIEFFKDPPSLYVRGDSMEKENSKGLTNLSKYDTTRRYKHRQSQIGQLTRPAATLTNSNMKRCFCTAQLYQSNLSTKIRKCEKNKKSHTLFKKCLCFFKKMKSASNLSINEEIASITTKNQKVNTRDIQPKLEHFTMSKKLKTKGLSVNHKNVYPNGRQGSNKYAHTGIGGDRSKQLVRVGSSFNFNIDFFKNIIYQDGIESEILPIKKLYDKNKLKNLANDRKKQTTTRTQISNQIIRTRSTKTGISPLKRCLCTMSLIKPLEKLPLPTKSIKTSVYAKNDVEQIPIRSKLKLLPYECEPHVCVPGECNVNQCLDMIKKRHLIKNSGVSPAYSQKRHRAITANTGKETKHKRSQIKHLKRSVKSSSRHFKHLKKSKEKFGKSPLKQVVRLGSNFSFDIEFYKNEILNCDKKHNLYKNHNVVKKKVHENSNYVKNKATVKQQKKFNNSATNKDIGTSQKIDTKKVDSTFLPFFKRCFCVLKLHKIGKQQKQESSFKSKTGKTQTILSTNKENRYTDRKLEPFECAPGVCVPGKCNPYHCRKLITKRLLTESSSTEMKKPRNISTYSTTNELPLSKSVILQTMKKKFEKRKQSGRKLQVQKPDENTNRQVVRIGSDFSFNVEFFKSKYPDNMNVSDKRELKSLKSLKNGVSHMSKKTNQGFGIQSAEQRKKESKRSSISPFLKRCFCTLTFQKTQGLPIVPKKCLNKKCDPLECEKISKVGKKMCISRNTQVFNNRSEKSVNTISQNLKSHRNQINVIDATDDVVPKTHLDQVGPVPIPKFGNINKRAVKYGSNFNFNVEFYKENIPTPVLESNYDKPSNRKSIHDSDQRVNMIYLRNRGSQGDTKTENKSTEEVNVLKRCFCTLELHNKAKIKNEKLNLHNMGKRTQYPQSFEVRRVAVHQTKPKMLTKKTHIEAKSVATKINKQYILKEDRDISNTYNLYVCRNGKPICSNDMITILPYVRTKFNKTKSKTMCQTKNNSLLNDSKFNRPKEIMTTRHGKRLTSKNSKKHFLSSSHSINHKNKFQFGIKLSIKNFFRRCAQLFHLKTLDRRKFSPNVKQEIRCNPVDENNRHNRQNCTNNVILHGIKYSKSETNPNQFVLNSKSKKFKSLKYKKKYPYYTNPNNNLLYQCGDIERCSPEICIKINKKQLGKFINNDEMINRHKQPRRSLNIETHPIPFKQHAIKNNKKKNILCINCLTKLRQENTLSKSKDSDLKDRFTSVPKNIFQNGEMKVKSITSSLDKQFTNNTKSERVVKLCKYCHSCGRYINKEIHKAAGDQLITKKSENKLKTSRSGRKKVDNVCSGDKAKRPLLEMRLDSVSYDILNKDEVINRVTKLNAKRKKSILTRNFSKNHGKSCRCCMCLAKQHTTSAKVIVAKGSKDRGSLDCVKKLQKIVKSQNKLRKYKQKPCVCGSRLCERESIKSKTIPGIKKLKKKELKKEMKERSIRLKLWNKEDRLRRKKRRKENKRLKKKINKNTGDAVLLSETVIDIGKLGITAGTDILRVVARSATDPKHAYKTLQTLRKNPKLLAKHLKSAYNNSGIAAATKRVRLRCLAMKSAQKVRATLERHAITKYLLYIASKDPKRRLVKPRRIRERTDFGCSLYMGSLRKRPFLSIYNTCPYFYPHFLSLVNVWKQFMDISLFLLAVVVWSPCILCMEVCRAMTCCFFCTG